MEFGGGTEFEKVGLEGMAVGRGERGVVEEMERLLESGEVGYLWGGHCSGGLEVVGKDQLESEKSRFWEVIVVFVSGLWVFQIVHEEL